MRRHRKQLLWGSLVACSSLVACNAITGLSDDYRLGQLDSADGSAPGDSDVSNPTDASTNDVTSNDGDSDAGRTYDSGFCDEAMKDGSVIACSDFESASPLTWSSGDVQIIQFQDSGTPGTPAGKIEVSDNAGFDPSTPSNNASRGLVVSLDKMPSTREIWVGYEMADDLSSMTALEFSGEIRIDATSDVNNIEYAGLAQLTFPKAGDTALTQGYGLATFKGALAAVAPPGNGSPQTNGTSWKHFVVKISGSSTVGYTHSVSAGGVNLSSGSPTVTIRSGAYARAMVGVFNAGDNASMRVWFDNLVLSRVAP